ncbi:MFS transporter [Corynebacterium sp. USCH3]|uniref:MFS transporter n=1 Tax=Corynebacterium sp. USCH3 TaxID=3024840 RepID=UPI0030B58508
MSSPPSPSSGALRSAPLAARIALAVVLVAEMMNALDHTIVLNAIPTLRDSLGAGPAAVQWLTVGYSLALAVGLVTGGRLGDAYGRRRVFLIGTAVFTVASLSCGIAPTPETLVASRILQGAGAAIMLPQALATIHVTFSGDARSRAFGLYGAILAVGDLLGPVLSGVLLQLDLFGWGWRSIFLVNLPICIAVLVFGRRFITESTSDKPARLDVLGMLLSAVAVTLIVFPLTQGAEHGWPLWAVLLPVAGLLTVGVFIAQQRTRQGSAPTIVLSMFSDRGFSAGLSAQLVFGLSSGLFFVTMTIFLQTGLGMSALQASMAFVLVTAGSFIGVAVAVRSAGRFGRRLPQAAALFALAGVVAFLLVITQWQAELTMVVMAVPLMILGCFIGAIGGPLADLSLRNVEHAHAGSASGLFNTAIHLGMALGTALTGAVFFSVTGGSADGALNREAFTGVLWTVGAAFVVIWALMFLIPRRAEE